MSFKAMLIHISMESLHKVYAALVFAHVYVQKLLPDTG